MKKILFWTISVVAGLLAVSCGKSEKKAETKKPKEKKEKKGKKGKQ